MFELSRIETTAPDKLRAEVEQKTSYTLDKCELNIFETHRRVENIRLTFGGFAITSMLRGKKVLHEKTEEHKKNYLPGESYIVPHSAEMVIDFPDANYHNPTQCTALVIDNHYLQKQIDYLNEMYPRHAEDGQHWQFNPEQLWLQNDENIAGLSNRLIRIFSGSDPLKDILVDLRLKELVLSIMRLQNYNALCNGQQPGSGRERSSRHERFAAVVEYIRRNITSNIPAHELSSMACMSKSVFYRTFSNEFGISPGKMVLNEKIRQAKLMMEQEEVRIKEICFALGFSDPNYFSRAFKKVEGVSPLQYMERRKQVS